MDNEAPGPGRRAGLTVGRLFGVPVHLNASMLVLAVTVTVIYGEFVRQQLDLSRAAGYAVGAGFVVCLLGSVLLHELGHALTARRFGIGVRGITLELLGGYTEMDRDAPRPRVDLLVSLAGPAVSLVLGVLATATTLLLPDGILNQLSFQLAISNLVVAVFNSLPGLPLDGGRALRAAIWAVHGDRHLATEVAGWSGRALAGLTAAGVLATYLLDRLSVFGLVFMLLVTLTLWQGAGQSIRLARMSRRFPMVDLSHLARPIFAVPAGTPLAEAQRRGRESGLAKAALVVADASGRVVALVDGARAAEVPADRRPWVAVDTVALGVEGIPAMSVDLTGEQVVRVVQTHPGAQYLVTQGEDVVGVLHLGDLAAVLEPRRGRGNPAV